MTGGHADELTVRAGDGLGVAIVVGPEAVGAEVGQLAGAVRAHGHQNTAEEVGLVAILPADEHHAPVIEHRGRPVGVLVEGQALHLAGGRVEAIGVGHRHTARFAGQPLLGGGGRHDKLAIGQIAAIANVVIHPLGRNRLGLALAKAVLPELQAVAVGRILLHKADALGIPIEVHAGHRRARGIVEHLHLRRLGRQVGNLHQLRIDAVVRLHHIVAGHTRLRRRILPPRIRPEVILHRQHFHPGNHRLSEHRALHFQRQRLRKRLVPLLTQGLERRGLPRRHLANQRTQRLKLGALAVGDLPILGHTPQRLGINPLDRAHQALLLNRQIRRRHPCRQPNQDNTQANLHRSRSFCLRHIV